MTINYGVAETIGRRRSMEDTYAVRRDEESGIFSAEVYDGHSGSDAAFVAAEMLTPLFLGKDRNKAPRRKIAFTAEALREAYLATDRTIRAQGIESGTAAATLYIRETGFLAGNTGDCRIVVGEGSRALTLTRDHKPDVPEERARIEALGGSVVTLDVARVQGSLSMSRALGDRALEPFVTAEPRIAEGMFGRRNDIAIIGCDGLWDVVTPDEAIAVARSARGAKEGADRLCALATGKGSTDNITVMVVDLKDYAKRRSQEDLRVFRVLDRAIEGVALSVT
jgi:protein phosphatase 1L